MFKAISILTLSVLLSTCLSAQDIQVRGAFMGDTIKLGKAVDFYLTAKYPSSKTILFPDTTFAFSPFEIQKKRFFTTQTKENISYDSVIYTLTSYEIDSLQMLRLPVFVAERGDCLSIYSQTDTLFFKKLVYAVPDSLAAANLPLKTNTNYWKVKWQFNYIVAGIVVGSLLMILIIVWIFFGKKIRSYFKARKLKRSYEQFVSQFDKAIDRFAEKHSVHDAESALVIWKSYLENLLSTPYTKWTTKEIQEVEGDDTLIQHLRKVDRLIYGNVDDQANPFAGLKEYCESKYKMKLEEVKHG